MAHLPAVRAVALAAAWLAAPATRPTDDALRRAGESFVDLLAKGDFAAAVETCDDTMKKVLPEAKLRAAWQSVTRSAGGFRKKLNTRMLTVRGARMAVVACRFHKAVLDVKVVFDARGRVSGLWFAPNTTLTKWTPPDYARGDAFEERAVTVGRGKWALGGTLALPKAGRRLAGVVLVHGSGPHDRDETVGANKPFRDLAWGLASRGLAVLRYDKRTHTHAKKFLATTQPITPRDETIDDAVAAVRLLRGTRRVDPRRVFVLGHSLGGMLAPRIARAEPRIAGLVILAGPARPLEDLLWDQNNYVARLDGKLSDEERAALEQLRIRIDRIKDPKLAERPPAERILAAPVSYWLDLRGYRPAAAAAELGQPMLLLHGGRDYQVTDKDLKLWRKHLAARKDVTFKRYPKLNHLFIPGEGPSRPAEYMTPGHIAPQVIEDIAHWIKTRQPGAQTP